MVAHTSASASPDYLRWPLYWFARLESALEAGDLEQAAHAQSQLKRLGLRVEPLFRWQEGERSDAE